MHWVAAAFTRFPGALRTVFQLAIVAVALQLAGAARVAEALFEDGSACAGDCTNERNGHDCPPGCPSCHCAHGGVGSLPLAAPANPPPVAERSAEPVKRPTEAQRPSSRADRDGVFRPPRA